MRRMGKPGSVWAVVMVAGLLSLGGGEIHAQVSATERSALLSFYQATTGSGWTRSTGWGDPPGNECTWYGVSCDDDDRVVSLSLRNNGLVGSLSPDLAGLTALRTLELEFNQLSGTIPAELAQLEQLTSLDLSSNRLSGPIPSQLGELAALTQLDLKVNRLTDGIPAALGGLESLNRLDLSYNALRGTIPPELGALENLRWLYLDNCYLTGEIPAELGDLGQLLSLELQRNQLTGSLPPALGQLDTLFVLNLYYNQLDGPIPPELGDMANLRELNLGTNGLDGELPSTLGRLSRLELLLLTGNELTGSIPASLGNLSLLERLWLDRNHLSGEIPPSLGNLSVLDFLELSNNQLSGTIPPELGGLSSLRSLDLQTNRLVGGIPGELGQLRGLRNLNLSNNELVGPIPPELGGLVWLEDLFLFNTVPPGLYGELPAELMALTRLDRLVLCGNSLWTDDESLASFLDQSHAGGSWRACQTPVRVPVAAFLTGATQPLPGEAVEFVDTSLGSPPLVHSWDFEGDGVEDSADPNPVWTFPAPGVYPVRLTVSNPYGSDGATVPVVVPGDGTAPVTTSVTREFPGLFLEGIDLDDRFDLGIAWAGSPGSIAVAVDGGSPVVVPGSATGGSFDLDLGSLEPAWAPIPIEITPTNGEGVAGVTQTEFLRLFPYPPWLHQALDLDGEIVLTVGAGEVVGALRFEHPRPHLEELVIIPDTVPFLGGQIGIQETFARVEGRFSSLGDGAVSLFGQTGFLALDGKVTGRVGGQGELRLDPRDGLVIDGASFSLGLAGTIERQLGLVEAIPGLATVATLPGIRWVNERARLVGSISPSLDMTGSFGTADDGFLAFREATGSLGFDLQATLEVDVISDHLSVRGWVAGGGRMTLGLPEPWLRQLEAHVEAGVSYELDALFVLYEGEIRCRAWCGWTPGTGVTCDTDGCVPESPVFALAEDDGGGATGGVAGAVAAIERDYRAFGDYAALAARPLPRRASSAVPLSVAEETVVSNVFPGASPTVVATDAGHLLLWEHQDLDDPVLQSTEIAWSFDDGTGWTPFQLVADDARVELAPVARVDEAGRVVAAWTRIADPAFAAPIDSEADLATFYRQLQVVTAIFDPVTGSWSTVAPIAAETARVSDLRMSASPEGRLMLTWLANPSGALMSTAEAPSELRWSTWDSLAQAWSPPAAVASGLVGVAEHAPAAGEGEAIVVLAREPDPDAPDDGVLDLYRWDDTGWSFVGTFAAGGVENRSPAAVYDGSGEGHVVWWRDGDLVWATLGDPVPLVIRRSSGSMSFFDTVLSIDGAGHLTVLWQEAADNGPANLFARVLDPASGTWSVDRRLTEEPATMHCDPSGVYGEDGVLRLAYLATEVTRVSRSVELGGVSRTFTHLPELGRTDLRWLEHTPIVDLAVDLGDLVSTPPFPAVGEPAVATLTVHNAGDFATGGFRVALYAGHPDAGGVPLASSTVAGPFAGGDAVAVELPFVLPSALSVVGEIVAVVDADDDVAEASEVNNRAVIFAGDRPPIAVVRADPTSGMAPLTVSFDATDSHDLDGDGLDYSWSFGDGTESVAGPAVTHTFTETGRFPVVLEVIDRHGARDAVTVLVTSSCVADLVLADQVVDTAELFSACETITAGAGFVVGATGDVTLEAGRTVVLDDGFAVESGGRLRVVVD